MFSFTFNGRSSKDFGITVGLRPNQISADRKVERVHIEGANGDLIEDLGANTYTVSFPIYIEDKENIDSIKSWLMGKGKFTRTDRPGQEIIVYFYQLINFERIVEGLYQAMLTYTVTGAHWEKENDTFVEPVAGEIVNEGNVYSRPIIRLEKQSQLKGDITINNVRFLYEFKDGDTYLEIDGETQSITDEVGANRNRSVHIGYDFPILLPGHNLIKVNSGDAIIKMRRKDRWK